MSVIWFANLQHSYGDCREEEGPHATSRPRRTADARPGYRARHGRDRIRPHVRHEAEPGRLRRAARGARSHHQGLAADARGARTSTSRSRTARRATRLAPSRTASGRTSSSSRPASTSTTSSRRGSSTRSGTSSPTTGSSRTRSSSSPCAPATRRRSRAGTTSSSPGVEVITANPFTSGAAKWNILAAYGAQRKLGQDRQAGA